MKPLIIAAFALTAVSAALASPAMAADVSGTWQVDAQFADSNGSHPVCMFQQATFQTGGERFAGSCKGPSYLGIVSGTVQGQQVQFTWDSDAFTPGPNQVQYSHIAFSGTLGGDGTIKGSATDTNGAPGTFTATRK